MLPTPPHWTSRIPPGRSARASRPHMRSWSVTQCSAAAETITSTGSGRPRSSTSWRHTCARPPSRARASATISSEASMASTRPCGTSASSDSVTRPVPQPTSSTVASGGMPSSRAMTSEAHACCGALETSYACASHGVAIAATGLNNGNAASVSADRTRWRKAGPAVRWSGERSRRLRIFPDGDLGISGRHSMSRSGAPEQDTRLGHVALNADVRRRCAELIGVGAARVVTSASTSSSVSAASTIRHRDEDWLKTFPRLTYTSGRLRPKASSHASASGCGRPLNDEGRVGWASGWSCSHRNWREGTAPFRG